MDFWESLARSFTRVFGALWEQELERQARERERERARQEREEEERRRYEHALREQRLENAAKSAIAEYEQLVASGQSPDWKAILEKWIPEDLRSDPRVVDLARSAPPVQRRQTIGELAAAGQIPGWEDLPKQVKERASGLLVASREEAMRLVQGIEQSFRGQAQAQLESLEGQLKTMASLIAQRAARREDTSELERQYRELYRRYSEMARAWGIEVPQLEVRVAPGRVEVTETRMTPGTPAYRVAREYEQPTSTVEVRKIAGVTIPAPPGTQVQEAPEVEPRRITFGQYLVAAGHHDLVNYARRHPELSAMLSLPLPESEAGLRDLVDRFVTRVTQQRRLEERGEGARTQEFARQIREKALRAADELRTYGSVRTVDTRELLRQAASLSPALASEVQRILSSGLSQRVREQERESRQERMVREREERQERRAEERESRREEQARRRAAASVSVRTTELSRAFFDWAWSKAHGVLSTTGGVERAEQRLNTARQRLVEGLSAAEAAGLTVPGIDTIEAGLKAEWRRVNETIQRVPEFASLVSGTRNILKGPSDPKARQIISSLARGLRRQYEQYLTRLLRSAPADQQVQIRTHLETVRRMPDQFWLTIARAQLLPDEPWIAEVFG